MIATAWNITRFCISACERWPVMILALRHADHALDQDEQGRERRRGR